MKRREFIQAGISLTALTGCSFGRYNHRNNALKKVFKPIKIGNITIPNRIVFPPITPNYTDDEGFVTQRLINYYKHVAKGGVGLCVVHASVVRKDGGDSCYILLDDDKCIDGLRPLFKIIKQYGSIASIQLYHDGSQVSSATTGMQRREIPKELSVEEIKDLVNCFAESAYRAKLAGADMIELHGAHGYLINKFQSPLSNKRNDEYGGNTEKRTRFVKEIVEEIRKKVGNNYPICCRISAVEYAEGGLTIEESQDIAQILVDSGIDLISVSVHGAGSKEISAVPYKEQGRRCYAHISRAIKESVDVPVICVGNILDINDAEIVLQNGDADMAAMGRAQIADPYLISKTRQGRSDEINHCIQCRRCIWFVNGEPYLSCSVNKNL